MATPIKFESFHRDAREELLQRLDQAPAEHAEALLALFDLLQGLQDRGTLDTLKGALSSSDFILEAAVETMNTPENVRAVRNLLLLGQLLGSIDPDLLERLAGAIPEGVAQASASKAAPFSAVTSAGAFRNRPWTKICPGPIAGAACCQTVRLHQRFDE